MWKRQNNPDRVEDRSTYIQKTIVVASCIILHRSFGACDSTVLLKKLNKIEQYRNFLATVFTVAKSLVNA